ncbi:MAG: hypothetical protein ACJ8GN_24290, partial [Longimicrobiaceae bacterium]
MFLLQRIHPPCKPGVRAGGGAPGAYIARLLTVNARSGVRMNVRTTLPAAAIACLALAVPARA